MIKLILILIFYLIAFSIAKVIGCFINNLSNEQVFIILYKFYRFINYLDSKLFNFLKQEYRYARGYYRGEDADRAWMDNYLNEFKTYKELLYLFWMDFIAEWLIRYTIFTLI